MNCVDYEKSRIVTDLTVLYDPIIRVMYYALGIGGETGEIQEKIKKLVRDNDGVASQEFKDNLTKELGDVLWYLVGLANLYGITLDMIMEENIKKLQSRKERNVIHGSGDNR